MSWLRAAVSRLVDVLLRDRRDRRLAEELQAHLDALAADHVAKGLSPDEARLAARRQFGGVDQVTAVYRAQRGLPLLDAVVQDLRFSLRVLRRERSFALTAVSLLALGIGVNNMLFTILYAHTIRGLPIAGVERVVHVSMGDEVSRDRGLSRRDFEDLRDAARLTDLAAFAPASVVVGEKDRSPERFDALFVSPNALAIVSPPPALGRIFTDADDRPDSPPVIVISTWLWRERFGSDATIRGRELQVNGVAATVAGVLPARSGFPVTAHVWMPLARMSDPGAAGRNPASLSGVGRVRDQHTVEEARAEIEAIADRLAATHPDTNRNLRARVIAINQRYLGSLRRPEWRAFMTVGFLVVLISCANVAALLLGRAPRRSREVALRTALGASRPRIVRQLLMEAGVLAGLGGAAGLGVAALGLRVFRRAMPEGSLPYWLTYSVDPVVLAALIGVSFATLFVFGLVPAAHTSRIDIVRTLSGGTRATGARRGLGRWTTGFVAAEVALTVVLLFQAAVAARSVQDRLPSDTAVESEEILAATVTVLGPRYDSPAERARFHSALLESARALPGVTSASLATTLPRQWTGEQTLLIEGRAAPAEGHARVAVVHVGGRYFETLALPVVNGRDFADGDTVSAQPVAIVNERFARTLFADADPVGTRIALHSPGDHNPSPVWRTIVGVVPDVRQRSAVRPIVYTAMPAGQAAIASLFVRRPGGATGLTAALRDRVFRIDSAISIDGARSLRQADADQEWVGRVSNGLFLAITTLALLLAGVGLFAGVLHRVTGRAPEIAVRVALGATPATLARLVTANAFLPVTLGLVFGALLAFAWSRAFSTGAPPPDGRPPVPLWDPAVLLIVIIMLTVTTVVACLIPVWRAVRIDPGGTLRSH